MNGENSTKVQTQLNHRLSLIEDVDDEVFKKYKELDVKIESRRMNFKKELSEFKKEVDDLSKEVDKIIKFVYFIGNKLKEKVTKADFEKLKEISDEWKLEEYMTLREVKRLFNKYSGEVED